MNKYLTNLTVRRPLKSKTIMRTIIRLYYISFFSIILSCMSNSCSIEREAVTLPLLSCKIELLLPQNEFHIQKDNYEEGVYYILSSRKGAYIIAFEGALMDFHPMDTIQEFQISKYKGRTIFKGMNDSLYWRKDKIENIKLYYDRVKPEHIKSFNKIMDSAKIIDLK